MCLIPLYNLSYMCPNIQYTMYDGDILLYIYSWFIKVNFYKKSSAINNVLTGTI